MRRIRIKKGRLQQFARVDGGGADALHGFGMDCSAVNNYEKFDQTGRFRTQLALQFTTVVQQ